MLLTRTLFSRRTKIQEYKTFRILLAARSEQKMVTFNLHNYGAFERHSQLYCISAALGSQEMKSECQSLFWSLYN